MSATKRYTNGQTIAYCLKSYCFRSYHTTLNGFPATSHFTFGWISNSCIDDMVF